MTANGNATKLPEIKHTQMLINGKFVNASDNKTFEVVNPNTKQKIADVPEATEDDTNAAVAAAKAAFPEWSNTDPEVRGSYLKTLAALLREHSSEIAQLESVSMGRPTSLGFDTALAARTCEQYAEAWPLIQGCSSLNTPGFVGMSLRQPYGVAAIIIPWNAPVAFIGMKCAPALIAGNTVVLKSSEKAPLGVARVAELVQQAGFPPGVFNIISGHGTPSGSVLAHHMDVRVMSFTGSTATGKLIQQAAAKSNLKSVSLELGGKSPSIIFADAPSLERAVDATVQGIQTNSGQICIANSRLYVEKPIAAEFVELFKKKFSAVSAGDALRADVNHGPQVDAIQFDKVLNYIEQGKKTGKLALGGGPIEGTDGFFVQPTVFLDQPEDATVMKEEIFGPVVSINTFETEQEVLQKANDTEFGLYASVFTRDISKAMRVAKALESGSVGINCSSLSGGRDLPFGGYKQSGQGREGILYSIDHFLEHKAVLIKVDETS
ncbi:uncharacterized protein PpBr36_06149 [Pyricularia pennisetigena]|uniref:uncharacterized protein n=1 Tax=Pyricularia pennisetigena TaxID=1578925 RepID=UPI001154A913|nr:uncharacterized protein PpBr36_06149 [Pyricularia pennisetigena]TLS23116.1 hypothetical protein PpBr36_06149 [Pyricularia pennisetigena]